jgi:hypothetical protein
LTGAANAAMEDQFKSLIETNKFSAQEFKRVLLEQTKAELIATAARAAVQAIFQTALGLGQLALGNTASANLHFASAGQFAAISGATLAAAKALDSAGVGGGDGASSNTPTNSDTRGSGGNSFDSGSSNLLSEDANEQQRQNQNLTVVVQNPLGDENWDRIVEDQLLPAVKRAGERDVTIDVKAMPRQVQTSAANG